ncbi:MAG TPA: hypothetical protein EYN66_20500 [Myxococcales bacterium]|nr:hypothetical protein [Myxococcales bacterium]
MLYEGKKTPHRSCGIALAETFNRRTAPYQSLRKGGLTGCGECGAIMAGRLILGEVFGDPDPTGAPTAVLMEAMVDFEALWNARVNRKNAPGVSIVCNTLTGQFEEFRSPERAAFCTDLAATVAECVAEVMLQHGADFETTPIEG